MINRLRVVLAEKNKTNRWLAEAIGKNVNIISRWCNNRAQPSIEVLADIAMVLDVEIGELLHKTKE